MTASLQIFPVFDSYSPSFPLLPSPSVLATVASLGPFFMPFISSSPFPALFSADIWLLFGDLKRHVPPTPSVRLMFDKGPLKCADFRGCRADGLVGLQREQAGGLPSERDQLLPRHRHRHPLL